MRPRLRPRLAHAHQGFQRVLQILDIGRRTLVQDHEIGGEALHAPVLMRLQQLAGNGSIFGGIDAQQQNRDIA